MSSSTTCLCLLNTMTSEANFSHCLLKLPNEKSHFSESIKETLFTFGIDIQLNSRTMRYNMGYNSDCQNFTSIRFSLKTVCQESKKENSFS